MEFTDVLTMSKYWGMEPPISWMYAKVHGFETEHETPQSVNILPGTGSSKPWEKQPEHIRQAIAERWMSNNPGKTRDDFETQRTAEVKKKYASRLEEARKEKNK